ncbi:lysozyme family protein [Enterococcus durans]|uniref:lysozyme family protein n=1 Tax=Enterococcus durans TaxID=53345 RepID=UPI001D0B1E09|nr:lysozyme family protein [Enterococcus durans]MCB8506730.1 lysozyme family protein [Enterococcus durans]
MNKLKAEGATLIFFSGLLLFLVVGSFSEPTLDSHTSSSQTLPALVLRWEEDVRKEAEKNDISEAVPYLLGIIMIESGGNAEQYPDIFQCSESQGWAPNTISDPQQSIKIGVKYFAELWKSHQDYDLLNICQAYNYGGGYLSFCEPSYSLGTAIAFSKKQANGKQVSYTNPIATQLGYSYRYAYGNMFYSQLIQQYLTSTPDISNKSNSYLVSAALKELSEGSHQGGAKYWQWYGFGGRVEWCAVFVSYCINQAKLPFEKFAYCPTGISNFKAKNQWFGKEQVKEGLVIFFDWNGDSVSDHVGIVEKIEGDTIHTIEGNSGDMIAKRTYEKNSSYIMGYGSL